MLGGTSPLTGPAAAYASVARGAKAYFDSVDAKGGVAKRKIDYRIVDDAYNPAQTVQDVRRLVEQDKVFAVFNTLGTESNLAVRDYLNQSKVPQLFVASGATTWGRDAATYPWTIGFQPSYAAEGWVYGQYVAKTQKKARIGVLFQNDDYGKDLLGGLKRGLGRAGSKVVAAQPYEVTSSDVGSQIAKLKAAKANILAIFATPQFAIQAYVFANRLGWHPLVLCNGVSGTSNIMLLASEGGKNKTVEGTITSTILKDPADPRWKKDPGMKQYRAILARYAKGANAGDVYHVYGMAVAYETVRLLEAPRRQPDARRAHEGRALDHGSRQPVPPARDLGEDRAGRRLPDPAGPAAALDEGPLGAARRPLAVDAELGGLGGTGSSPKRRWSTRGKDAGSPNTLTYWGD